MTVVVKRARAEKDKEARREAILAAARGLLAEQPYEQVRVAGIARAAGLAKGTVYLYFATKEELVLALVTAELGDWFVELERFLGEEAEPLTPARAAEELGETLARRELLLRLLALLHSVLERNLTLPAAQRFKQTVLGRMAPVANLLERRLPQLGPGEGATFLLRMHAVVVGLHQAAHPSAVVAEALAGSPELAVFEINFAKELVAMLAALLRGWERRDG